MSAQAYNDTNRLLREGTGSRCVGCMAMNRTLRRQVVQALEHAVRERSDIAAVLDAQRSNIFQQRIRQVQVAQARAIRRADAQIACLRRREL